MEKLRRSLALILCMSLALPMSSFAETAAKPATKPPGQPTKSQTRKPAQLAGDQRILHALNRFTFGARPEDVEAVRAFGSGNAGLDKWFAQQLHPAAIDDSALNARLVQFPAMQLNTQDLLYRLPSNNLIHQAADGKIPVPDAGPLHAVYENEIERYNERQQMKAEQKQQVASAVAPAAVQGLLPTAKTASDASMSSTMAAPSMEDSSAKEAAEQPAIASADASQMSMNGLQTARSSKALRPMQAVEPMPQPQVAAILALQPQQRVDRLTRLSQPDFDSFRKGLKGPQRLTLTSDLSAGQKELVAALEAPQRVVVDELAAQRLTRDIYSRTQLQEVMTDFWLNHFNVYLHKNDETPYYLVSYERDVIRPHALGKFEDLLEATAHSPGMLLYLDNSNSIGPDSAAADKARLAALRRPDAKKQAPQGLNENYARELMELHTLGVNGGYTQADVTQVARVLTGWTVDKPQRGGAFKFDETRHEPGVKKVMGKKINESGEEEGHELLHLLATRPATAKFISRKLAIRFVGDEPPQALVDRMTKAYLASDGDIPTVLKALFHSQEFWSPEAYRAKVKTPLEFVVSAVRATDVNLDNMQPLANALRDMGMPLYGAVPPTGYNWQATTWVSTGALVNRMNFALTFTASKLPGITLAFSPPAGAVISQLTDTRSPILMRTPVVNDTSAPEAQSATSPDSEEQRLETLLIPGGIGASTRTALLDQFSSQIQAQSTNGDAMAKPVAAARPMNSKQAATSLEKQDQLLAGLLLGSPEFQRR